MLTCVDGAHDGSGDKPALAVAGTHDAAAHVYIGDHTGCTFTGPARVAPAAGTNVVTLRGCTFIGGSR